MECKYFGLCGSCTLYDKSYEEQLEIKKQKTLDRFKEFNIKNIDVISSLSTHFRCRAEFRIFHKDDTFFYTMNSFDKKPVFIDNCQIVNQNIYTLMPKIKEEILKNDILKHKLFSIEFLTSNLNENLVSLIYHKKLENQWDALAMELEKTLNIKVIGRSKKLKKIISKDFILDELNINNQKYRYQICENSFTQPNCYINSKMIGWVKNNLTSPKKDLLELYCGHGNFTIALSSEFNQLLATEISKTSIKSAKINSQINVISNVIFARLSASEISKAISGVRKFNRLSDINLDEYDFSHIFVDPPRAGLDDISINLVKKFDNIIYISCNQESLMRDLKQLSEFKIVKFAIFDQFAYTHHIETGIILKRL